MELFLQKKHKIFFAFLFLDPRPKSQILTPYPCPPFLKIFSLDTLNSEQKPSVKNRSTKRVRNRSIGVDFEIYGSGQKNPDRFHL